MTVLEVGACVLQVCSGRGRACSGSMLWKGARVFWKFVVEVGASVLEVSTGSGRACSGSLFGKWVRVSSGSQFSKRGRVFWKSVLEVGASAEASKSMMKEAPGVLAKQQNNSNNPRT